MKIGCIIPALNEEKTLGQVITQVKSFVDEVIVVDDGSSDQTSEIALCEGAILLKHIINRGQGAALQTGNNYALANNLDIAIHFDADGQFLANEIPDFIKAIEEGSDIVFGSRFLEKKSNMPFTKKHFIMPLARLVNKFFLKIDLTDPQSGFRALNRKALERISIEQSGWAHCSEILAKTVKSKLKFKEVPITVSYSKFGRSFKSGMQIIKDLFLAKLIN